MCRQGETLFIFLIEKNMNESDNGFQSPTRKHLGSEIDRYDPEVLEASIRKSYICKLAEKGGQKKNQKQMDAIIEEEQRTGMLRSCAKPFASKLFASSAEQIQHGDTAYELYFSNMGKPKETSFDFSCCTSSGHHRQKVEVNFSEYKELCVRSQKGKELYNINLNTIKSEVVSDKELPDEIILRINENFIFKFEKYAEILAWNNFKKYLQNAVAKGMGNRYEMQDLLQKPGFQKVRYKPVVEFAEHCQTGDILLFQGSHFFANVQRVITNSQYDHVGMVIRHSVYGILIFQSNSSSGVCVTPWELLIKYKWYKYIKRIVWRKLSKIERDRNFREMVQMFAEANLGKNYYISFDKLLSNKSFIASKDEQVGYFCSELVAVLYKDLKLLTRDQKDPNFKPSCNFYPYHFTQKFKLALMEGELSPEYIIHFNQQEVDDYYTF